MPSAIFAIDVHVVVKNRVETSVFEPNLLLEDRKVIKQISPEKLVSAPDGNGLLPRHFQGRQRPRSVESNHVILLGGCAFGKSWIE